MSKAIRMEGHTFMYVRNNTDGGLRLEWARKKRIVLCHNCHAPPILIVFIVIREGPNQYLQVPQLISARGSTDICDKLN